MDSKCALNGESFVLKSIVLKFNFVTFPRNFLDR